MQTSETNPAALQQLTTAAHSELATAADTAGLAAIYQSVARDLGNGFVLSYRSAATGPTSVTVSLRADGVHQVSTPVNLMLPASHATPASTATASFGFLTTPAGVVLGLLACYIALVAAVLAVVGRRPGRNGACPAGCRAPRCPRSPNAWCS